MIVLSKRKYIAVLADNDLLQSTQSVTCFLPVKMSVISQDLLILLVATFTASTGYCLKSGQVGCVDNTDMNLQLSIVNQ